MAITRLNTNAFGTSVNLASNVTGTLPAANGGSGRTAVTGNVLQVLHSTNSTQITVTTGSYTWTDNITLAITPSSSSNKIVILGSQNLACGNGDMYMNGTFFRDSTNLGAASFGLSGGQLVKATGASSIFGSSNWGCVFTDAPSSTSEITYKMKGALQSSGTGYMNVNSSKASLTLMEIAG